MKIIRQIYLLIIICMLICSSKSASLKQSPEDDKTDQKNKFSDNSNDPGFDILNGDVNDDNNPPGERRRVTKTVFIAPDLPDCSPGYSEDDKQRCNKVNKELVINETAYILFLSEKLDNVLFPSDPSDPSQPTTTKNESQTIEITVIEDPFKLNLPLDIDNNKTANNNSTETIVIVSSTSVELSSEQPSTLLPETTSNNYHDDDRKIEENNTSNTSSIIINKPNNNTVIINNKNEDKLFNDSDTKLADVKNKSTTTELPVIEYIDETNNFSYSDLVNYKIPEHDDASLNNKTNNNTMGIKLIDENQNKNLTNQNNSQTTTEISTSVDLHNFSTSTIDNISSTTDIISSSQDTISESILNNYVTSENSVKFITNTTESVDYLNATTVNVDDVMINLKEDDENVDDNNSSYSNNNSNNTTDNYQNIYHDKYSDNEPDDSKESDELLMHSETGITVTIPPSSLQLFSTPTEVDTHTTGSTISSEASINDDFIRETTLLNLNNNTNILANNNNDKNIVENNTNNYDYFENKNMSFPVEITSTNNNAEEKKIINENYNDEIKKINQVIEIPNKQILIPSTIVSNVNSELSDIKNDFNTFVKFEESPFVKVFDKLFPSLSSSSAATTTSTSTNRPNIFHFPTSKSDKLKLENIDIMEASSTNSAEIIIPDNEEIKSSSVELLNHHHRHKETDDIEIKYLSSTIANNFKEQYDIVNNFPSSINDRPLKTFDNERKKNNNRIKFPDNERTQNSGNQIKFPSKDANSISTSNDNKDRYNYHLNSQHNKYNNNEDQKNQQQQQQNWLWRAKHEKSLKQRSSPLHFWSRLPLNKTNLNHSSHSTAGVAERRKGRTKNSRRFNLYEGISPQDETRAFAITSSFNR
ncbi:putative uncharacterized protein DDB_G0287457 [Aphidius gifuensis]|uniref:putative uncharacterized protein DDB_G0287457 n=1 Tax=Aphidius gifuensis TaxID=684658 RepID=UPI001CDBED19|nr:putative uncharacterized protein DDB_G0287457 [Aphidius gifuensis]